MSEKLAQSDQEGQPELEPTEITKDLFRGLVEHFAAQDEEETKHSDFVQRWEGLYPDDSNRSLVLETVYEAGSPKIWRASLQELRSQDEQGTYVLGTVYELQGSDVTKYHVTSPDKGAKHMGQVGNKELVSLNIDLASLLDESSAEELKWGK